MRDSNRIPAFVEKLQRYWITYFPDWRFGQLMSNFVSFIFTNTKWSDIFYIEDEEMSALLDEFVKQIGGAK